MVNRSELRRGYKALRTEKKVLQELLRELVFETLLDAQAIARKDLKRFQPWRSKLKIQQQYRIAPQKVIRNARRQLHRWINSSRFYSVMDVLGYHEPEQTTKRIKEFARGKHSVELNEALEKYRSLKQGHIGKPLNRRKPNGH